MLTFCFPHRNQTPVSWLKVQFRAHHLLTLTLLLNILHLLTFSVKKMPLRGFPQCVKLCRPVRYKLMPAPARSGERCLTAPWLANHDGHRKSHAQCKHRYRWHSLQFLLEGLRREGHSHEFRNRLYNRKICSCLWHLRQTRSQNMFLQWSLRILNVPSPFFSAVPQSVCVCLLWCWCWTVCLTTSCLCQQQLREFSCTVSCFTIVPVFLEVPLYTNMFLVE